MVAALASSVPSSTPLAQSPALDLQIEGARALISVSGAGSQTVMDLTRRWIEQSARAVATYYGRFPVPVVRIEITHDVRGSRAGGKAMPYDPPLLQLEVPPDATGKSLLVDDWVLVHEMVHLAFPYMPGLRHNWMVEGLAVYVEPVARIMAGHMSEQQMWGDFVRMMPRGLPAAGDGGYDVTINWARTYWGGAMFCLLCDVRIRQQTANAKSLRDSLRAINARLDFSQTSDLATVLGIGDAATGTTVLMDAWKEMRIDPVSPDLAALWRELGVVHHAGNTTFDDAAPLASIRQAITAA